MAQASDVAGLLLFSSFAIGLSIYIGTTSVKTPTAKEPPAPLVGEEARAAIIEEQRIAALADARQAAIEQKARDDEIRRADEAIKLAAAAYEAELAEKKRVDDLINAAEAKRDMDMVLAQREIELQRKAANAAAEAAAAAVDIYKKRDTLKDNLTFGYQPHATVADFYPRTIVGSKSSPSECASTCTGTCTGFLFKENGGECINIGPEAGLMQIYPDKTAGTGVGWRRRVGHMLNIPSANFPVIDSLASV